MVIYYYGFNLHLLYDSRHWTLFMCFLVIYMFVCQVSIYFTHLKSWIVFLLVSYMSGYQTFVRYKFYEYSTPTPDGLLIHFPNGEFYWAQIFNVDFFLLLPLLSIYCVRNFTYSQVTRVFSSVFVLFCFFPRKIIVVAFIHRSVTIIY